MAGTWDYGPLGVILKRNMMDAWWNYWVDQRDDMYGVDAAIIMNPQTWVASGHVATFADLGLGRISWSTEQPRVSRQKSF